MRQILKQGEQYEIATALTAMKRLSFGVVKSGESAIESYHTKTRNMVRRALKSYDYRRAGGNEIKNNGYEVYKTATSSYKVKSYVRNYEEFVSMIDEAENENKMEFWAGYSRETGEMACFSMNKIHQDYCDYSTIKINPKYLGNTYPMYGLMYTMNKVYLGVRDFKYVDDGARSITEHSNIQPFLIEKFGFRKAYCHMQIEYVWWLKIAVVVLYPFRKIIPSRKVKSVLYQEEMARMSK